MIRVNLISVVISLIELGLSGCGGGFPKTVSASYSVSVSPRSITVAAGSTSAFTAVFTPSRPEGGSLTWSVNPASGGTINSAGVYTASGSVGNYSVVATWTPSNPLPGTTITGSAGVDVLPPPQLGAELNPELIQASGTIQESGLVQNAAVVGQLVPSVISTDANGIVEVQSGFILPVPAECSKSGHGCQ